MSYSRDTVKLSCVLLLLVGPGAVGIVVGLVLLQHGLVEQVLKRCRRVLILGITLVVDKSERGGFHQRLLTLLPEVGVVLPHHSQVETDLRPPKDIVLLGLVNLTEVHGIQRLVKLSNQWTGSTELGLFSSSVSSMLQSALDFNMEVLILAVASRPLTVLFLACTVSRVYLTW